MVRNVIAEDTLLPYIQNLGKIEPCSIGLILGQSTPTKDYVIHFARTPQPATKNVSEENLIASTESTTELRRKMTNFVDIPESWVGDHAKHATRMLPGGMYVLGIFISTNEDIFKTHMGKIRNIMSQINKNLGSNIYLHGNPSSVSEKLVLVYNSSQGNFSCKSIEFASGTQKPVEFKFMAKPTNWHQLDCNYQFDHLIPITREKVDWNLKEHLQGILETVENNLSRAVVMIDLEIKNGNDCLEQIGKKKLKNKNSRCMEQSDSLKNLLVNIFVPCEDVITNEDPIITTCSGDMHFSGQLAVRVFLHQKATIAEATQAVKEDIVRSLAARFEMHWDSLIEEEAMSPEEKCSVHEPPRRVLVPLPTSKITLSDYLFPGEGPSEALISLEELLDLTVNEHDVMKDLEIQADPGDYCPVDDQAITNNKSEDNLPNASQTSKVVSYMLIGVLVVVLAFIIQLLRTKYL